MAEENGYLRHWGVWPENDKAKQNIQVGEVASISESLDRLPLSYAKQIYSAGESGMGYHVFTVCFKSSVNQAYVSGGLSTLSIIQKVSLEKISSNFYHM